MTKEERQVLISDAGVARNVLEDFQTKKKRYYISFVISAISLIFLGIAWGLDTLTTMPAGPDSASEGLAILAAILAGVSYLVSGKLLDVIGKAFLILGLSFHIIPIIPINIILFVVTLPVVLLGPIALSLIINALYFLGERGDAVYAEKVIAREGLAEEY